MCSDEDRGWPEIVKEFTKNSIDFPAVYTSVDSELHLIYTICFSPADKFLDGMCSAEDLLKKIFR